jgi:hypothetical protein
MLNEPTNKPVSFRSQIIRETVKLRLCEPYWAEAKEQNDRVEYGRRISHHALPELGMSLSSERPFR